MTKWHSRRWIPAVALIAGLVACGADGPKPRGFEISLADSGVVVLTDADVASYVWDAHRILLSPAGIERWSSHVPVDSTFTPPLRRLGTLNNREFVLSIDGVEMYRGHFSSMVSSCMFAGVVLYDTLGIRPGEVWIMFNPLDGSSEVDLRDRPEIAEHFRRAGKLQTAG